MYLLNEKEKEIKKKSNNKCNDINNLKKRIKTKR